MEEIREPSHKAEAAGNDQRLLVLKAGSKPLSLFAQLRPIVLPYFVFSALWILLSDLLVDALIPDTGMRTLISIYKGWAFILITATLLYFLLRLEARARDKSEQARLESERKYREVFNATSEAIVVHSSDSRIIEVNDSMLRMFGYENKQEVLSADVGIFSLGIPPYGRVEAENYIKRALVEGPQIFEWRSRKRDGTIFWTEVSLRSSEISGQGCVLAVVRNISVRKKMEEALQLSQTKFEALFRGSPDLVSITSRETGRIIDANDRYRQSFGKDGIVTGLTTGELNLWLSPEDRSDFIDAIVKGGGRVENHLTKCRFSDGTIHELLLSGLLIGTAGEEYILANGRDITELRMTEQALRDSEARYRVIADNTEDVIWMYDLRRAKFTYMSPSIERLRGYTAEEALEQTLEQSLTPESYKMAMEILPSRIAAFEAGEKDAITQLHELDQWMRDGRIVKTEVLTRLLADEKGKAVTVLGVTRNITDRKTAELQLRSYQKWLERAEHVGRIGGWTIDLKSRKVWASAGARNIYGLDPVNDYDLSEIQKIPLDEYRPLLDRSLRCLVEKGEPYDIEFRIRRVDDGVLLDLHSVAEYDATEKMIYGVVQDVTTRKRVEEKIHELAALLDIANDAIYVRSLDYAVQYWSRGAERLYGWTSEEVTNKGSTTLFSRDRETSDAIQTAVVAHGSWSGERKQITKSGKTILVFSRLTLVRDNAGRPKAVMAINSDITEKKALETQFLRAQRLESLGALSSGIAHDLNNVLAPILLSTSLLRQEVRSAAGMEILATVESSARRGAEVVKQVLTFARGVPGEKALLQPLHQLREASKIIRETLPKNITIKMDVRDELWQILGDSTQLHQSLMNLCVNARDAMLDGGTLTIGALNVDADEVFIRQAGGTVPGPYVCVYVSDTGIGIPPAILEKIFEPFFTTKPTGQGTGLGLSTVLGIMKTHNGFVRVQSEEDKGTRIELFFPAQPSAKISAEGSASPMELPKGHGETILLVDDESSIRQTARRVLESNGYKVIEAGEGTEAVGQFVQNRATIALVLTDLMMPGMDGPSFIKVMKRISPSIPIICMSGIGDLASIRGSELLAQNILVTKPFANDKLLAAVHTALANKAKAASSQHQ